MPDTAVGQREGHVDQRVDDLLARKLARTSVQAMTKPKDGIDGRRQQRRAEATAGTSRPRADRG